MPFDEKAYMKAYRAANREKLNAQSRAYAAADPEKRRAIKARSYLKNKARVAQSVAAWKARNPEKAKEICRAWAAENPDKRKAAYHRYRAKCPALSASELRLVRACADGVCSYCLRPVQRMTLDHVMPVSRGGTNATENLVMACAKCNTSKHSRTPLEFMFGLPRLGGAA